MNGAAVMERGEVPAAQEDSSRVVPYGEFDVRRTMEQLKWMRTFVRNEMRPGVDFGAIPGTGDRPTLLLPGAQKAAMFYNCYPEFHIREKDLGDGHIKYDVEVLFKSRASQNAVAAGIGNCSTMESKYRWRQGGRRCPDCDEEAIIEGKKEYGGGYICYRKKGGCGSKFQYGDPKIESQRTGRVENPDVYDLHNVVLKMAKKRAYVDAATGLGCLSELFTQDLEDIYDLGAAEYTVTEETPAAQSNQEPESTASAPAPKASSYKPASADQLATISKLTRLLGRSEDVGDMTSAEASERIAELSRAYNEAKSNPAPNTKQTPKPASQAPSTSTAKSSGPDPEMLQALKELGDLQRPRQMALDAYKEIREALHMAGRDWTELQPAEIQKVINKIRSRIDRLTAPLATDINMDEDSGGVSIVPPEQQELMDAEEVSV